MTWLADREMTGWCGCNENFPGHVFHKRDCHAVPMPPAAYDVRIVGVAKASWRVRGWEGSYSLAQTLRRAHPDRWVEVKLDGTLCALLEPQAAVEESDQLALDSLV